MLLLTRKKDESILIAIPGIKHPIRIVVSKISGDDRKVRLALDAPNNCRILREELANKQWKID